MTVGNWNSETLSCNRGRRSLNYLVALDLAPYFQRLLLRFFFLSADIWDKIIDHFGPCFEILACSRNRLICAGENVFQTEFSERMKRGNIALDRAVGFYCNKSALSSETFSLSLDNLDMIGVYLRNYHRYVGSESMCGIVGNYRAFSLCVSFFQSLYLVFFHINCAEAEIYHRSDLLNICRCVHKNHVFH